MDVVVVVGSGGDVVVVLVVVVSGVDVVVVAVVSGGGGAVDSVGAVVSAGEPGGEPSSAAIICQSQIAVIEAEGGDQDDPSHGETSGRSADAASMPTGTVVGQAALRSTSIRW